MLILYICHCEFVAGLAIDHDGVASMTGFFRIIVLIDEFVDGGMLVRETHRFELVVFEHCVLSVVKFGVCVFAALGVLRK